MIQVRTASIVDGVDGLVGEAVDQESAGLVGGDAAGAQVVQGGLVELADGGAVLAGDVVGQDLESGLGVDLGPVGQQEVVVGLLGVGAVGARDARRSHR